MVRHCGSAEERMGVGTEGTRGRVCGNRCANRKGPRHTLRPGDLFPEPVTWGIPVSVQRDLLQPERAALTTTSGARAVRAGHGGLTRRGTRRVLVLLAAACRAAVCEPPSAMEA